MATDQYNETSSVDQEAREGTLDLQLFLPVVTGPAYVAATVRKRDGSEVAFDTLKIADAIERAGSAAGEVDRSTSRSLASAVALYLSSPGLSETSVQSKEIDTAAERVLREMGYERTARSYVRHREHRRRLAAHSAVDPQPNDDAGQPYVRARETGLTPWDRERIATGLVAETGIESGLAERIADEVEEQVRCSGIREISASFVRELVVARMLDHGLTEHHQRYARLGVPLFEAERLICAPAEVDGAGNSDPVRTSAMLASRVKEEFAFTSVYSRAVADAHHRRDLHVHHAGMVDRLCVIDQPLERVKRFGVATADWHGAGDPARRPDGLVGQVAGQTAALRPYFAERIAWDGINFAFAPYVHTLDPAALRDVSRILLYEFAFRALSQAGDRVPAEFAIYWDVPRHMHGIELVGPGGAYTERSGEAYLDTARNLAKALLEVCAEERRRPFPVPMPLLVLHLAPAQHAERPRADILAQCGAVAAAGTRILVRCDDQQAHLPHAGDLLSPTRIVAHRVTLNLPRAAYRARSEKKLFDEIERTVELAAMAHLQKKAFLDRLLEKRWNGPLGLLAARGTAPPLVDLARATFVVGVLGLNECVQTARGPQIHEDASAADFGQALLDHLRAQCEQWSEDLGMDIALEPTTDDEVSSRFALSDLELFGTPARTVVKSTAHGHGPCYTPGSAASDSAPLSPMERVRLEGRLHPHFGSEAYCRIQPPEPETAPEQVAELIEKAFMQTRCSGILFG